MHLLKGVQQVHYGHGVLFQVPTQNGDVFMCATRSDYNSEQRAIVVVDAERFLQLWRRPGGSHDDIAHQDPATWPSDYKYDRAITGFSRGETDPVPLALVHCYEEAESFGIYRRRFYFFRQVVRTATRMRTTLSFTNGITRTIWLLTEGAKEFPVECDIKSAALLEALAGVPGCRYQTFEELIPEHFDRAS